MTWDPGISVEIAAMFADYSWHADELQAALEERRAYELARAAEYRDDPLRRKKAVERTRQWNAANPERRRELTRAAAKRARARAKVDPEFRAKYLALRRAQQRRARERAPEKTRAVWREQQRRYRERKRAALGLSPVPPGRRGRPRLDDRKAA